MTSISVYLLSLCAGLLFPVYGVGVLVASRLQDHQDRLTVCTLIYMCQGFMGATSCSTFVFSFIFRTVLIRFSDRGLVVQGRPNLTLFHQLYWVVFGAFFCTSFFFWPVLPLIMGTFEDSLKGGVCMFRPMINDEMGLRETFVDYLSTIYT